MVDRLVLEVQRLAVLLEHLSAHRIIRVEVVVTELAVAHGLDDVSGLHFEPWVKYWEVDREPCVFGLENIDNLLAIEMQVQPEQESVQARVLIDRESYFPPVLWRRIGREIEIFKDCGG